MPFDLLKPVSGQVLAFTELLPPQSLGRHVFKHTEKKGLPVFATATVAIVGVLEYRTPFERKYEPIDLDSLRKELYQLMNGNWNTVILDIGDIEAGETLEDTYFLVRQIVAGLVEERIIPLVIAPNQDITYATYRSFDGIRDLITLANIDSRFDFGDGNSLVEDHSYMSRIITDKPNNLLQYINLGYQTYFNAQEEIDLMDRLFFDAYRLGELTRDIAKAEPILRQADMVSVDMHAVQAMDQGGGHGYSPNGFNGREICALMRYAGMSDSVFLMGIYEMNNSGLSVALVAQMIWYFIEGLSLRIEENPLSGSEDFSKFTVPGVESDLVFYKSMITSRWWMEAPVNALERKIEKKVVLLPCNEEDYLEACNEVVPDRWLKAYKRSMT